MDDRDGQSAPGGGAGHAAGRPARQAGLLAGMRVRKKLIVLHTLFWLVLAGILGGAIRPALREVVQSAEAHAARLVLGAVSAGREPAGLARGRGVVVRSGGPDQAGLSVAEAAEVRAAGGREVELRDVPNPPRVAVWSPAGEFLVVSARLDEARASVWKLYLLMLVALLAVYGLVAAALEVFVLPQHVYGPIRRLLEADRAVREGDRHGELIPESGMPADELGMIMRSRNEAIRSLRTHERDLGAALAELGQTAADLKLKNHLLETAQRNLADAGRLASLGMMSAGLAHELNTPLAVLKGLAEKLASPGGSLSRDETALMVRVVGRLERLSENLLDLARARPMHVEPVELRSLVEESWLLVRLDRGAHLVEFVNAVPRGLVAECSPDRIGQVLLNILRNAVDALPAGRPGRIEAGGALSERSGRRWVTLSIADNGPGVHPEVLGRLFEPFVTTRLDSLGTGLGLAVAEGIVREHGGVLLGRNRPGGGGAVFEIVLPAQQGPEPAAVAPAQTVAGVGGGAAREDPHG